MVYTSSSFERYVKMLKLCWMQSGQPPEIGRIDYQWLNPMHNVLFIWIHNFLKNLSIVRNNIFLAESMFFLYLTVESFKSLQTK